MLLWNPTYAGEDRNPSPWTRTLFVRAPLETSTAPTGTRGGSPVGMNPATPFGRFPVTFADAQNAARSPWALLAVALVVLILALRKS